MLASGSLVCANDTCWRVMTSWYKEKKDGQKVDSGAEGGSVEKD